MHVTQRDFEQQLGWVEARVKNRAHGLYGPSSMAWRIGRESIVFLCAGRAALLQLAHPYVAHAIDQHSATHADPIGRFNRTFLQVYGMVFGDLDSALASARRVRAVHDRVHGPIGEDIGRFREGHRYHAHEVEALVWVYATLLQSSVMAYELAFGPLSLAEKDAYQQEMTLFARLFGLPEASLPSDWQTFEGYCARMEASGDLAVGRPAREMARFLLTAASGPVRPFMRWYTTITAGLLPPRIRQGYALPWGRADERLYEGSLAGLRRAWPKLPARLRHVPAYVEALHRLEGRPRPDRIGRAFEQMILRAVRPA